MTEETFLGRLKTEKELIKLGWIKESGQLTREGYYSVISNENFLIGKILLYKKQNAEDLTVTYDTFHYWFSVEAVEVINTPLANILYK